MTYTANFAQEQFGTVGIQGPDGVILAPGDFLLEREIRSQIFDKYEEDTMFDYLMATKRYEISKGTGRIDWFEHDPLLRIATVESATGTGAGAVVAVVLEEADHLFGASATTGTRSPFQKNDVVIVHTSAGPIHAQVNDVDTSSNGAHVIDLDPIDDADDLGDVIAAADKIQFVSRGAADGTGQPTSSFRVPVQYTNYMQIFKERFTVTGSESANKSTVQLDGKNFYYHQGVMDADLRLRLLIDYQLLLGKPGTKPDATDASKTVRYTESIDSVIEDRGNEFVAASGDFISQTELAEITEIMRQEDNPVENLLFVGQAASNEWDDVFGGYVDQGGIVYNQWGGGSSDLRAIDLGFDSVRYGGFVFHKKNLKAFDYKGATAGLGYSKWGFLLPLDAIPVSGGEKLTLMTKANDMNGRIMRYHQKDQFEIDGVDAYNFDMLTEFGSRFACANQYWKIVGA
jgi:hypothetical protein